jgi:hypothetical protein
MFRLWCKIFDSGKHLVKDITIEDDSDLNRTKKIFNAISKACIEFDLSEPIWLDSNVRTFQRYSKVRFNQDNFLDSIDFDYMEVDVIEED